MKRLSETFESVTNTLQCAGKFVDIFAKELEISFNLIFFGITLVIIISDLMNNLLDFELQKRFWDILIKE